MKIVFLFIFCCTTLQAQNVNPEQQRQIAFPDIPGYLTLKCDLHQHTVFSDGHVWPTIRVREAIKDDLDAIAVTEHLEHQPHKDDIPHPDRNRAYEIEKNTSKGDLIIINGSEITRDLPLGHINAVFVQDANRFLIEDSIAALREAKKQGAFIFWNHPHWTGQKKDGIAELTNTHKMLLKENLLQGIEVVNEFTYSDEALQIALDNNLTILGTSDVHGLVDWDYQVPYGGHRPITLVFAKERTESAVKEALINKRTVAFFKNVLIGRKEYLAPLLNASLPVKEAWYDGKTTVLNVVISNPTSCAFILKNISDYTFQDFGNVITIRPRSDLKFQVKTITRLKDVSLRFQVLNAVYAPAKHPDITLQTAIQQSN